MKNNFKNIGFMMLGPDATWDTTVLDIFKTYGIQILLCKIVTITDITAEKVYQKELLAGKISSWWIKNKFFSLGPCFVALVGGSVPHNFSSFCDYLLSIKGASDPNIRAAGTIRDQYEVPNKAFGFMHSSDDIESAMYEASLFFENYEIERSIIEYPSSIHKFDASVKMAKYINIKRMEMNRSYVSAFYNLKTVLLQKLKAENILPITGSQYNAIFQLYQEAYNITKTGYSYTEEKSRIIELLTKEQEILELCLKTIKIPPDSIVSSVCNDVVLLQLVIVYYALSCHRNFNRLDGCHLIHCITANGIYLDDWDKLLLESSLFFF